jgi:DNA-binding Lrp family transcriptional regulator
MTAGTHTEQAKADTRLTAAATVRKRRARLKAGSAKRLHREAMVMRYHFGDYLPVAEIAVRLGVSAATVTKDIRRIEEQVLDEATSEGMEALARHVATLYTRAQEAYEETTKRDMRETYRIQWFKVHLDVMREVAELLGYKKQAGALLFIGSSEQIILAAGGIDSLEAYAATKRATETGQGGTIAVSSIETGS